MGTKNTDSTMEEVNALVDAALVRASDLLKAQIAVHGRPFDAFVTLTLSVAVLARSMDMPRETLLEGVGAAFDSLQEEGVGHVH